MMDSSKYENKRGKGGIYIHVPFCRKKCNYCNFFSISSLSVDNCMDEYVQALVQNINNSPYKGFEADSIYFGGGTPSLLSPVQIERILRAVYGKFKISSPEITIEVNPGSIGKEYFSLLINTGVNRVNIGVQSLNNRILKLLGRIHGLKTAVDCFYNARNAGFKNIGLDIIYGIPGQSMDDLENDLESFMALSPEHISAYMLSVEDGTRMVEMIKNGEIPDLDEQAQADSFLFVNNYIKGAGYIFYEVSNYAKDGYFSRHNMKYWNYNPYLGFGPSAHSFYFPLRWSEPSDFNLWLENIRTGQQKGRILEFISKDMEMMEFLYLGLRQSKGIDKNQYKKRFFSCFDEKYSGQIKSLVKEGYVKETEDRLFLTESGFLFLDHITEKFI